LVELRRGGFQQQVWHFALGQDIARDAAAVVVHVADTDEALDAYGDRAYRYLHMDAGHVGQILNLAALALGFGASGIGGFFDDEVSGLLGLGSRKMILYVTVLGATS